MCKEVIAQHKGEYKSINLYFEDETRFGLFTKAGKALTARGVKPVCQFLQLFRSIYLFGSFSPLNGDHFLFTMPECNSLTFQEYLNEFSKHHPEPFKAVVLDKGAFHKAKALSNTKNIVLIFLPFKAPYLIPLKKYGGHLNETSPIGFFNLDELEEFITQQVTSLTNEAIQKTCAFDYIFLSPF